MTDPLSQVAGAVGSIASGVATGGATSLATSVFETFSSLFKLAATPEGLEYLDRMLPSRAEIAAAQTKLDAAIAHEHHVLPKEGTR